MPDSNRVDLYLIPEGISIMTKQISKMTKPELIAYINDMKIAHEAELAQAREIFMKVRDERNDLAVALLESANAATKAQKIAFGVLDELKLTTKTRNALEAKRGNKKSQPKAEPVTNGIKADLVI